MTVLHEKEKFRWQAPQQFYLSIRLSERIYKDNDFKNEIIDEDYENTARKIKEKFIFKREHQNIFAGDDYFERLFLWVLSLNDYRYRNELQFA